jgi:uncharacterized hydrophobic protein (TIGR00271 family)
MSELAPGGSQPTEQPTEQPTALRPSGGPATSHHAHVPSLPDARMALGPAILADLYPEGAAYRRSLVTYAVLLTLAGFIATFGLYQDSVAAIIGAMVVAPLGGAIMAFAGSLVSGRTEWQPRTFLQVALGALGVIALASLVSLLLPDPLVLNPSIEARTAPGLLDLGVALAAGAAGAYVTVRRTGTDALPGVAIAVSLVPPLATVGICLELGRIDDAGGALILFLTNFAAIVVAASIVFIVARATPAPQQLRERRRLRNAFIASMIALALITVPLAWNSISSVRALLDATAAAPLVRAWIGDRALEVTDYRIDGNQFVLHLVGPDRPASTQELAADLAAVLGQPVELEVEWVASVQERATAGQ